MLSVSFSVLRVYILLACFRFAMEPADGPIPSSMGRHTWDLRPSPTSQSLQSAQSSRSAQSAQSSAQEAQQIVNLTELLVSRISDFEAARPNILRAVPCCEVLRSLGGALRGIRPRRNPSFTTATIMEFWSHSWHGGVWIKVLTMFMLKNGPMAVCFGWLGALLMAALFATGMLPSYERVPFLQTGARMYPFGPWSLCTATLVATFTLRCWRRKTSVFLDVLCIDQDDARLKTEALLSIGAFLKKSQSLHVFWDETWVRRLWCVFLDRSCKSSFDVSALSDAVRIFI